MDSRLKGSGFKLRPGQEKVKKVFSVGFFGTCEITFNYMPFGIHMAIKTIAASFTLEFGKDHKSE